MKISNNILATDVLVIGSGIAGCFAAMRARELGADVVMVEQGKSGLWGMSTGGTHRLRVVLPEDDLDAAMKGTVAECEYMVDQEFLQEALKETWPRFQDLLKLGADFRRDDRGQFAWHFVDTAYPDFKQRNVLWEPIGSYKHILKINKEVLRRGVKVIDRVLITDLLCTDGRVTGACGFDTREGDFYLFKARAVVMASGGFSGGGAGNWPALTGDGIGVALRAGAELRGMEFGKAETGGILPGRGSPRWISILFPQEKEVTITNARGEEFLEKYEFGRRVPGRTYYGPPWRVHVAAMLRELREGSGPCYVDYRTPNRGSRLREFWGAYYDRTVKQMALTGTTLDQIKYELAISGGYNLGGGIRISPRSQSSLTGLYAGGQASDMCGIAQYTIVSGMMASSITGRRAGESASEHALAQSTPSIDERQAEKVKNEMYAPLGRKQGTPPDELRMKMIKAWLDVDLRTDHRLKRAHETFRTLRRETAGLMARDTHELVKCHKMRNYLECSDAVGVAALARQETRLEHIREDYPLTDNQGPLKWVIVRREGDDLTASLENIPLDRWKYRPEPRLFDRLQPVGGGKS